MKNKNKFYKKILFVVILVSLSFYFIFNGGENKQIKTRNDYVKKVVFNYN